MARRKLTLSRNKGYTMNRTCTSHTEVVAGLVADSPHIRPLLFYHSPQPSRKGEVWRIALDQQNVPFPLVIDCPIFVIFSRSCLCCATNPQSCVNNVPQMNRTYPTSANVAPFLLNNDMGSN